MPVEGYFLNDSEEEDVALLTTEQRIRNQTREYTKLKKKTKFNDLVQELCKTPEMTPKAGVISLTSPRFQNTEQVKYSAFDAKMIKTMNEKDVQMEI